MRVLQVVTRLNVGGVSPHVLSLARELARRGCRVLVAAGRTEAGEGSWPEAAGRVLRVPGLRRAPAPAADGRALAALWRLCRRWRPQVVHTHMSKAGLLGTLAARAAGVPLVCHTYHGVLWEGHFGPLASAGVRWTERRLARWRDEVFAVGASTARALARAGIARRATVLPPAAVSWGPPAPGAAAALRRELGLPSPCALVLAAGRLVRVKGLDLLFAAVARPDLAEMPLRVLVAGDGPERPRLAALARARGLDGRVLFLGWRADVPRLLQAATVVAVPSRNEGVPRIVLEALAAGRPVVAAAVGEVPDLLEHGRAGLLVPPEAADALAAALRRVLEDPELRRRLGAAAGEVSRRLGGSGADRVLEVYRRRLGEG